jgi:hypothetical protein
MWNAVVVAHDPAAPARVALEEARFGPSDRRVLSNNADRQRRHHYQHYADDPPFTLPQHGIASRHQYGCFVRLDVRGTYGCNTTPVVTVI